MVGGDLAERDPESLEKYRVNRSISHYLKRLLPSISEKEGSHSQDTMEPDSPRIDAHPMGYPRLASLMNSDENFLITRRYGWLHNRVMLYRQDELRMLENQLMKLDQEDEESDPRALKSRKRDDQREGGLRRALIKDIDDKLKEYDDIVLRNSKMSSLQAASPRNHQSVENWIFHNAPLCATEAEFIRNRQDFVALVDAKEGSWFDGVVEDTLSQIPCTLTRLLFIDPEKRTSTEDELVRLYSKARIDTFARLVITILAVALLMVPVVVLFSTTETGGLKIAIILLFTLFFSISLSLFTKAKRHEVFAATAAYCAVLVVFLGDFLY
ncbi:hypothetical protein BDY21DRAFT_336129 [Lineolata rhizophorae]|uniref:DUF6594 domain-containing protein n=1 Tax=Lineolata rhizophorae TaxID=578093 RepID=A0A6A6P9R7_9PEZI|nr:hypothetical protein BDY21DRAFT_336129 [Lineolata rhizophorae]